MNVFHGFDIQIAEKVGVNCAVVHQRIAFWCEQNKNQKRNIVDGHAWTYDTQKAIAESFPYFSENQVRRCLEKLVEQGFLVKGNYNKNSYDKTLWYRVSNIWQNCQMDAADLPNGCGESAESLDEQLETSCKPFTSPFIPQGEPKKEKTKERNQNAKASTSINTYLERNPNVQTEWFEWSYSQLGWNQTRAFETFECFADYWRGNGGKKVDWFATWRNWCRRDKTYRAPSRQASRADNGGLAAIVRDVVDTKYGGGRANQSERGQADDSDPFLDF